MFDQAWGEIVRHAGGEFRTITGLPFKYRVASGDTVRVIRNGREIRWNLSKENFKMAFRHIAGAGGPRDLSEKLPALQGPSYVYAILADRRIRLTKRNPRGQQEEIPF